MVIFGALLLSSAGAALSGLAERIRRIVVVVLADLGSVMVMRGLQG